MSACEAARKRFQEDQLDIEETQGKERKVPR